MQRIAVFCGASKGGDPLIHHAARIAGQAIAARGMGVVYGGGHVGLMGAVADAALQAGGEVIGVIPGFMVEKELAHAGLTELIVVHDMHERKMRMHERSDAVIALPGGFGTMDELFELLTWRQLGLHAKPMGLLNVNGFYSPLLEQIGRMEQDGFLHGPTRVRASANVDELLDGLMSEVVRVGPAGADR
ncbi:MAG: TIGR00730 family Rossman fold protein [Flavobacteriales bacterium]|nr:TIGR00730 family Rossman fold protein [Flavobacteriales bacterium]